MGRHRRLDRSPAGQSTLEHVGMVAVAAALVVVLVVAAPGVAGSLAGMLRSALCDVFGTSCASPARPDAARTFEPPPCEVASRVSEDGGSVKVAFVKVGADYTFTRSETSRGETKITFVDGSKVAAVAGLGGKGKVTVGGRSLGAELEAGAEAGIVASRGDTWVFPDPADADRFEGRLRREKNEDRFGSMVPVAAVVNGVVEWVTSEEPLGPPTITFTEAGADTRADASAVYGDARASAGASAAALVGVELDARNMETTAYYQVDVGAHADAGAPFTTVGGTWEGSGVLKVTKSASGELVRLELVDTSTGSLDGLTELDTGKLTMAGLMDELAEDAKAKAGASESSLGTIVSTTRIDLASDRDRAVARRWLNALNVAAGISERAVDGGLPDDGRSAVSPFGRLLYEKATVSVVEHTGRKSGLALEAEVALGAKLGLAIGSTDTSSRAVDAWYLDGPDRGRRVLVPFTSCLTGR